MLKQVKITTKTRDTRYNHTKTITDNFYLFPTFTEVDVMPYIIF